MTRYAASVTRPRLESTAQSFPRACSASQRLQSPFGGSFKAGFFITDFQMNYKFDLHSYISLSF